MNGSISTLHVFLYPYNLFYKVLVIVVTKMSPRYTICVNSVYIIKMTCGDMSPRFCHHFANECKNITFF